MGGSACLPYPHMTRVLMLPSTPWWERPLTHSIEVFLVQTLRCRYERIRLEALAGRVKDTSTGSSSQGSQAHTGSTGSDSSSGSTGRSTSSGGAGSSTDSSSRQGQLPQYELVVASEVIEHVKRPDVFIKDLASLTVPGGTVVLSTINRTPASFAVAIVGAEYVSGIVPK